MKNKMMDTMSNRNFPGGLTMARKDTHFSPQKRKLPETKKRLFDAPAKVTADFPARFMEEQEEKESQSLLAESMPSPGKKSACPMAGGSQPLPEKSPFKVPIKKVEKKLTWGQILLFCPNPDLLTNFYVS
jgi:hypothetical protein